MKYSVYLLLVAAIVFISSCQDDDKKKVVSPETLQQDSIMADVMDGHNVGMAKMSKIRGFQVSIKNQLDSLAKLPVKARAAATVYKAKLDSIAEHLNYAETAMDKWMTEFDMDSARNNMQKRLDYLLNERMKVGKVKEAILKSLHEADSVMKSKL